MTIIAGRIMQRRITPRSLGRAQWFADLFAALNEAEQLLALLDQGPSFAGETLALRRRIRSLSSQLERLDQVARGEGRVIGNSWPESIASQAAED